MSNRIENQPSTPPSGEPSQTAPESSSGGDSIAAHVGDDAKKISVDKDITQNVIEGRVETRGDFVGRDKHVHGDEVRGDKFTIGTFINNLWGAPETQQYIRARKILLDKVYQVWVEGVLNNSLHKEVLITLGLEEKPSAVDNQPFAMVLQMPAQPDRPLPSGTSIFRVFQQHQQRLLILGAPGAGKTTMLLTLAQDLLVDAQQDETAPIPVVLHLSTWSVQRLPLHEWIEYELNNEYRISQTVARTWVERDSLMLLLDGLDEVQEEHRTPCVEAINTFSRKHNIPLVVCSRIAEYELLDQQLQLQSAVVVQPLMPDQVSDYFERLGTDYQEVRVVVEESVELWELAKSPLMLSIMTLAYRGITRAELAQQSGTQTGHKHLFDTYIMQMFCRRSGMGSYTPQQTLHWLSWLAEDMSRGNESIFLIERLQPKGLSPLWRLLYKVLVFLVTGLGIAIVLSNNQVVNIESTNILAGAVRSGLAVIVIFSILNFYGIAKNIIEHTRVIILLLRSLPETIVAQHTLDTRPDVKIPLDSVKYIGAAILGLLLGLAISTVFLLVVLVIYSVSLTPLAWLLTKTPIWLVLGIYWAQRPIQPVDFLQASLRINVSNFILWSFWGASIAVSYPFVTTVVFGLALGLIGGLLGRTGVISLTSYPNEGIIQSAKNILYIGLLLIVVFAVFFTLSIEVSTGLVYSGVLGTLVLALFCGGGACIQHILLRLLLWGSGYAPLNYARFLDYAVRRIFLHKVGGGYIFIHGLLMKHFETMKEKDIKRLSIVPANVKTAKRVKIRWL